MSTILNSRNSRHVQLVRDDIIIIIKLVRKGFRARKRSTRKVMSKKGGGFQLERTREDVPPEVDENIYPEGGLKAWLVVFGALCGGCTGFGLMNSSGPLQAHLETNQLKSYSPSDIGWIFSTGYFLCFFSGLQIGPVFDRYGPRYLIATGSVLLTLCVFLAAESSKYWQFMMTLGVLFGLGSGLLFTPSIGAIGHFFLRRRGLATGIGCIGGAIGGIVYPSILSKTLQSLGWAWSLRIIGFVMLIFIILCNLLVRSRLPPLPGKSAAITVTAFKDIRFTLCTAAIFLSEFALFIPLTYLSSYAIHNGMSANLAFNLQTIINVGSIFGRFLGGYSADRLGRFNSLVVLSLFTAISTFAFWYPAGSSVAFAVIFAICFGFGSGSFISLTPVAVGQICRTEEYGRFYGTAYTVVSFGTLTGVPIAGQIIALWHGRFDGVIIFAGVITFGAAAFFAATRLMCSKRLKAVV